MKQIIIRSEWKMSQNIFNCYQFSFDEMNFIIAQTMREAYWLVPITTMKKYNTMVVKWQSVWQ